MATDRVVFNHEWPLRAPIVGLNARGEERVLGFTVQEEYFDLVLVDDENSDADQVLKVRPASQNSIENLEKVRVETSTAALVCCICLEEISGVEAIRMPPPCLHLYHQNCIIKWLNKCNTCPLCRYELP